MKKRSSVEIAEMGLAEQKSKFMKVNTAYKALTSKRPCGPNKDAIRAATYDLAKNDPWKEPFENLPEHAFEDVADWERKLIQERVRGLRGT
ncbi:hypothetical protein QJS10_CPA09g01707 [Acorus calamus]|uniref:J domain-containing protein n=1 Tax=Acorus calamus TaxID=4465 RepID=A0AAV9E6M9_ACOCL|nr:hypothetical protein QJS10_CPA09g01707 [Acorus calamus]